MEKRPLTAIAIGSAMLAVALSVLLVQAEAKPPQAGGLQAQVAAQGKLISALQARVAALEHGSSSTKTAQAHVTTTGSGHSVKLPSVTHKLQLADLSPGLSSLTARHSQFLKIGPIHPIILPTKPPTAVQQLSAQVAQLSSQVTQLTTQVNSLQSEIVFDENLFGTEFLLVQKNMTALSNAMPVMPQGQGFCGGNAAMSWGGFKYYLNNSRLDNALICYLAQ